MNRIFARLVIFVLLECNPLHAETTILRPEMQGVELYRGALTWIDKAEAPLSDPCESDPNCAPVTDKMIQLKNGFGGSVLDQESLYMKKKIFNPTSESITAILTLEWATIDEFELLLISGHQKTRYHADSQVPIKSRDFQSRYLNVIVTFPPGESILISRNKTINFHKGLLRLWDEQSLDAYLLKERLILWLLYGILGAMILSYLSIFISSKDHGFFWPAFSLFFLTMFDMHYRAYYLEFLNAIGSDFTYRPFKVMIASALLANAGLCRVIICLDNFRVLTEKYHTVVNIFFVLILGLVPITYFLPYKVAIGIVIFSGILTIPAAIAQVVISSIKKVIPYYFFLPAGLPLAVGFWTFIGQLLGFFEANLLNDISLLLGFCLMGLTLGLDLGVTTVAMRKERQQSIIHQQAMKASLEVAKVVQQSLLPHKKLADYATYRYYKPAETVGGDSFYYERYHNLLITAIFDVTGHGISSAIMTGTIAGAMNQSFLYEVKQQRSKTSQLLVEIGRSLNETILEYNRDAKGHLVTMACGIFDVERSVLYYLNAGHIPSYLIKKDQVVTLTSQGSPLGLRSDPIFSITEWHLDQDDKILFLTDGVTDNLTIDGKSFRGRSFIKKLRDFCHLSAENLGEHFEAFLESKILGKRLSDDMTFLIIGRDQSHTDRSFQKIVSR